ncbi:MAG: FAD-dependent monooxygenase [Variovorax sp.]|nr:FAD-dependent monooxygenase [Variovorax sp.]
MNEPDFDVIVVGAGPAGLTLANLLGTQGVRTLLIEKDTGLSGQPKALNIDDEFFRLLAAVGLGPAVSAHAKFPISYDYVSPIGLNLGHVQGRWTEHNFPNRAATFQPEFEAILAEGARASGAVQLRFDRALVAFEQDAHGVRATARAADGREERYAARYLVGADGAHSACRRLLGLSFDEVDPFDVRHVVVDVRDDIDPSPLALTRMGWRRNFFSMPAPNGRRFEFSLRAGESAEFALADDTLRQWFRPYRDYDRLDIIRKVVHTFRARIVPRLSVGRVFLIGDAAHLMPVFGSQGMNSGARDANNLGWKLLRVLRHGADPAVLDSYHAERWDAVRKTVRMATLNGRLQAVKSPPMSLLRDLVFGVLRLVPPASRYIREMRYVPKAFLRSALVSPGTETGRAHELVGRLLPNPEVRFEGRKATLDEAAGLRFAVIGVAGATPHAGVDRIAAALGAARIVLVAGEDAPRPGAAGAAIAASADARARPLLQHYAGQWLLVRPDRVVACAGTAEAFVQRAEALLPALGGR